MSVDLPIEIKRPEPRFWLGFGRMALLGAVLLTAVMLVPLWFSWPPRLVFFGVFLAFYFAYLVLLLPITAIQFAQMSRYARRRSVVDRDAVCVTTGDDVRTWSFTSCAYAIAGTASLPFGHFFASREMLLVFFPNGQSLGVDLAQEPTEEMVSRLVAAGAPCLQVLSSRSLAGRAFMRLGAGLLGGWYIGQAIGAGLGFVLVNPGWEPMMAGGLSICGWFAGATVSWTETATNASRVGNRFTGWINPAMPTVYGMIGSAVASQAGGGVAVLSGITFFALLGYLVERRIRDYRQGRMLWCVVAAPSRSPKRRAVRQPG